jgi:hypothetical protein
MSSATAMPVGFADFGHEIDTGTLREIHAGLGAAIADLADAACERLGITDPNDAEITFYVELPDEHAGPLAAVLESLDLAWRLGWAVAEMNESELPPSGGSVDLDQLLPVTERGLVIERIEIGSIRAWFTGNRDSLERGIATLSSIVAIAGVNVHDAISTESHRVDGTPCQVKVIGEPDERTSELLKKELPGLPPNCLVKVTIKTPDGARIVTEVPSSAFQS